MKWTPRKIATGLGAAIIALGISGGAQAQTYPNQRITFVVGFAAGGFADSVARIIGDHVSQKLGQPVVVESRAGAGSNIAASYVAHANPDGYTVLVSTTGVAINATLYKKLDYNLVNDLIPVAIAVRAPETFSVNLDGPKTLQEFLDKAKTKPFTFGSAGIGSGSHLTMYTFFKTVAKVNGTHIPYQGGGPAKTDTIGGHVDGLAATASSDIVSMFAKGGLLRCLAVAAPKRYDLIPDCPTLAEAGFPNYEGSSWVGFWVPKGTPANVVNALNAAINSITDDKDATAKLKQNGDLSSFSPAEASDFVKKEVDTWGERVKASGVQQD
jgi:tripartite-type tricarboxylate transporter receptor subunit TctC